MILSRMAMIKPKLNNTKIVSKSNISFSDIYDDLEREKLKRTENNLIDLLVKIQKIEEQLFIIKLKKDKLDKFENKIFNK